MDVVIRKQTPTDDIPWDLLLEADPSQQLVEAYLRQGELWLLVQNAEVLGVYVLYPVEDGLAEVKSVSVAQAH
ncbi:MAG TPA: GNAT family N-acetyltransferase, partial [Cytophagales bacterium]|nr:GNAT family N-acetyltransferase [Cytophagales bacterium]